MPRDASRTGAIAAAAVVAAYLPLQPVVAWLARAGDLSGAAGLDGLARWTSTAVVLLLGAALATVLLVDHRRRRGAGTMQRWATGAVAGLAVLVFLSALLTLTQAFLTWRASHAGALALIADAAVLVALGAIAFHAVEPRRAAAETVAVAPTGSR